MIAISVTHCSSSTSLKMLFHFARGGENISGIAESKSTLLWQVMLKDTTKHPATGSEFLRISAKITQTQLLHFFVFLRHLRHVWHGTWIRQLSCRIQMHASISNILTAIRIWRLLWSSCWYLLYTDGLGDILHHGTGNAGRLCPHRVWWQAGRLRARLLHGRICNCHSR